MIKGKTRPWLLLLGAIAAVPVLLFGFALAYPSMLLMWHARTFDSSGWHAAGHDLSDDWPTRLRMAGDLTRHQKLIGLSREQLFALLGPTDDITAFRERSKRTDDAAWDVGYELGPERGPIVRIDNDWLLSISIRRIECSASW